MEVDLKTGWRRRAGALRWSRWYAVGGRGVVAVLSATLSACGGSTGPEDGSYEVQGVAPKGPYLRDGVVTVAELDQLLGLTGRTFPSNISDDRGRFRVRTVELASPFVLLQAEGLFFNEVTGSPSTTGLTLSAMADLSDTTAVNVNVLTHLEQLRVEHLIRRDSSFAAAKRQAMREILAVFEIVQPSASRADRLDLSRGGAENAVLLAVSAIVQGALTTPGLAQLLADMGQDLEMDGTLDAAESGSALINAAQLMNLDGVRANLEFRYNDVGDNDAVIPSFEPLVRTFRENTDFEFTAFIDYPDTGTHGTNLLVESVNQYETGTHSFLAVLPTGTSVRIRFSASSPNWSFPNPGGNSGWEWGDFDSSDNSRMFTSTRIGAIELQMLLNGTASGTLEIYENDEQTPSRVKQITW